MASWNSLAFAYCSWIRSGYITSSASWKHKYSPWLCSMQRFLAKATPPKAIFRIRNRGRKQWHFSITAKRIWTRSQIPFSVGFWEYWTCIPFSVNFGIHLLMISSDLSVLLSLYMQTYWILYIQSIRRWKANTSIFPVKVCFIIPSKHSSKYFSSLWTGTFISTS